MTALMVAEHTPPTTSKRDRPPGVESHHLEIRIAIAAFAMVVRQVQKAIGQHEILIVADLSHPARARLKQVVESGSLGRRVEVGPGGTGAGFDKPVPVRLVGEAPADERRNTLHERARRVLKHEAVLKLDAKHEAIADGTPERRADCQHRLAMAVEIPDFDERRYGNLDADGSLLKRPALLRHDRSCRDEHGHERRDAAGLFGHSWLVLPSYGSRRDCHRGLPVAGP